MGTISHSSPAPGVALVTIDSPPANALGSSLRGQLLDTVRQLNADLKVRVIVLTGVGSVFCAGDDLKEAMTRGDTALDSLKGFADLLEEIELGRVPVIAAVNGAAVGGGFEIALACDIRVAATSAHFTAAGVNIGLMASTYRLPRLIGVGRAKAILLTGEKVGADQALAIGLVTAVHAADDLLARTLVLADRIASRAPLSIEATKRQATQAPDLTPKQAMDQSMQELGVLASSDDHRAAIMALMARQTPTFTRS